MKKELVTTTISINADHDITVDGYVHYYVDKHYGEDADGKRGESRTFVEDVTNVNAYDVFNDTFELNEEGLKLAEVALTYKFLEG